MVAATPNMVLVLDGAGTRCEQARTRTRRSDAAARRARWLGPASVRDAPLCIEHPDVDAVRINITRIHGKRLVSGGQWFLAWVRRAGNVVTELDGWFGQKTVEAATQLARMPPEGTTVSKANIVWVWMLAACATGGSEGTAADRVDASVMRSDASSVATPDAPRPDASVGADAQVSQLPDAGGGSGGLFCTANAQCTVSGECCLTLGGPSGFCAPGTIVLGECVPF